MTTLFRELSKNMPDIVGNVSKPDINTPIGHTGETCQHSCSCHSTVQHNCYSSKDTHDSSLDDQTEILMNVPTSTQFTP